MDAPYSGGFVPGGRRFAVDGDWATWGPHGPPEISNPFEGDGVFSGRDVVYLGDAGTGDNWLGRVYFRFPIGVSPNIQPWFPNQDSIVIEQTFRGALSTFQPMRLNTPYNPGWSEPWLGTFLDGIPSIDLSSAILVREGELKDIGGGLAEIVRRFAAIPKSRALGENFSYLYPGLIDPATAASLRPPICRIVFSRIQLDYFVFDEFPVLGTPLFPLGNRLDSTTGIYPSGLILNAQKYYGSDANSELDVLKDESSDLAGDATIPSATEYLAFMDQTNFGLAPAAELIAETSTMRQWMGNIWERATRFVPAL